MLRDLLNRKKVTMYALAKKNGIPYSTINSIVNNKNGYENCSVRIFKSIANTLGLSMDELYKECRKESDVVSERNKKA